MALVTFTDASGNEVLVTPNNPLPTSAGGGSGASSSDPVLTSGTIAAASATLPITIGQRDTLVVHALGTFVGTMVLQGSGDGNNWVTLNGATQWQNVATNTNVASITTTGIFQTTVSALTYVRLFASAWTSGSASIYLEAVDGNAAVFLDSPLPAGSNTVGTVNLGSGGTGATALGKAEDAAHASGDTGVAVWGVRAPATPTTPTSAAGDYGYIQVDAEGKIIVSGSASDASLTWASATTLTTTTATAAAVARGAGIRNFVTDATVTNSSATPVKVTILDGATVLWRANLAAADSLTKAFSTPLRGTAATAINIQLSAAVTDVDVSLGGYQGV